MIQIDITSQRIRSPAGSFFGGHFMCKPSQQLTTTTTTTTTTTKVNKQTSKHTNKQVQQNEREPAGSKNPAQQKQKECIK